jgi:hypothetical protein
MKLLIQILLILFCLTAMASDVFTVSFFDNHGIFYLIGWALFPRIMFWFFSAMTGGFFFWLGVFLVPRIMVAYWATYYYFDTNPILCLVAWFIALSGESAEKTSIKKASRK